MHRETSQPLLRLKIRRPAYTLPEFSPKSKNSFSNFYFLSKRISNRNSSYRSASLGKTCKNIFYNIEVETIKKWNRSHHENSNKQRDREIKKDLNITKGNFIKGFKNLN